MSVSPECSPVSKPNQINHSEQEFTPNSGEEQFGQLSPLIPEPSLPIASLGVQGLLFSNEPRAKRIFYAMLYASNGNEHASPWLKKINSPNNRVPDQSRNPSSYTPANYLLQPTPYEIIGKSGFRWREKLSEGGQKLYLCLLCEGGDRHLLPAFAAEENFDLETVLAELRGHELLDETHPKILKLVRRRP